MSVLVIVGANETQDAVDLAMLYARSFLFEPLPDVAKRLNEKLAGVSGAVVVQAACGPMECKQEFFRMNKNGLSSSVLKPTQQAIDSFSHVDLGIVELIQVQMVNLNVFLDAFHIDKVDYIQCDAQGMDLEILRTLWPRLRQKKIGRIRTESDGEGFQHYEGVDNSESSQRNYMKRCGYVGELVANRSLKQPDIDWVPNGVVTNGELHEFTERATCPA